MIDMIKWTHLFDVLGRDFRLEAKSYDMNDCHD